MPALSPALSAVLSRQPSLDSPDAGIPTDPPESPPDNPLGKRPNYSHQNLFRSSPHGLLDARPLTYLRTYFTQPRNGGVGTSVHSTRLDWHIIYAVYAGSYILTNMAINTFPESVHLPVLVS